MDMNIEIKLDPSQVATVKAMLGDIKNAPERVLSRAINKTTAGVKTDMSSEVRTILNASKAGIDKTISIKQATVNNPTGMASMISKPTNLADYKARQISAGVEVQIYQQKGISFFEGAFIATVGSHKAVFRREYKGKHAGKPVKKPWKLFGKKYRFPIKEVFGPRAATVLEDNKIMPVVLDKAGDRIVKNLDHELEYEISRWVQM